MTWAANTTGKEIADALSDIASCLDDEHSALAKHETIVRLRAKGVDVAGLCDIRVDPARKLASEIRNLRSKLITGNCYPWDETIDWHTDADIIRKVRDNKDMAYALRTIVAYAEAAIPKPLLNKSRTKFISEESLDDDVGKKAILKFPGVTEAMAEHRHIYKYLLNDVQAIKQVVQEQIPGFFEKRHLSAVENQSVRDFAEAVNGAGKARGRAA